MKTIAALVFAMFAANAFAQRSRSCEAKAVSASGKKLGGAAKNAFSQWRLFPKADVERDRSPASRHSLGDICFRAP